ncbi:MAG TPA: energy transducer TonB [Candidatus Dormibacteraeota bacterium]|nr:energy transducer TonB [Candidatus Dormibacteraeota bacterium]
MPVLFPTISVEPSVRPVVQPSVKPVVELEAAQLLVRHNAVYPPVARAARISGPVELQFTVGVDGRVRNVKVMKGNGLLAQAAVTAVKSWRYRPARRGGVPLESQSTAVVNFKLN